MRPVEDRIAASKEFIERAKKRIVAYQTEVSQAQEALAKVQSKLQFEEQDIARQFRLRACLSELRQENTDLRAQLQSGRGEERERKHPRSLATCSLELALAQTRSRSGAKHAINGRRFTQNGDSHRQRRSKFAFESIQSLVWVINKLGTG